MSEETATAAETTTTTAVAAPESILTVATGADSTQEGTKTEGTIAEHKAAPEAASTDEAAKKDADGADGNAKAGAPEKYELELPEGMVLDEALWAEAEPILREASVSNEVANKLAALQAKTVQSYNAKIQEAWGQQNQEWLAELKADPTFGGNNFKASAAAAQSAVAWIGGQVPGFQAEIERLGIQNNPALARGLAAIGRLMAEDKPGGGKPHVEDEGNTFLPGSKRR